MGWDREPLHLSNCMWQQWIIHMQVNKVSMGIRWHVYVTEEVIKSVSQTK